eukprot:TRINITY_DN5544_c0_g1_i1.p1 TRINITY_DN5544_c0_g1~~TRINITY_DN5544_c0_g1_i1.p1  ORF type:complete len:1867 (-),score=363.84 TRINITY_DN5544_c0_g1_i1:44-5644(-)
MMTIFLVLAAGALASNLLADPSAEGSNTGIVWQGTNWQVTTATASSGSRSFQGITTGCRIFQLLPLVIDPSSGSWQIFASAMIRGTTAFLEVQCSQNSVTGSCGTWRSNPNGAAGSSFLLNGVWSSSISVTGPVTISIAMADVGYFDEINVQVLSSTRYLPSGDFNINTAGWSLSGYQAQLSSTSPWLGASSLMLNGTATQTIGTTFPQPYVYFAMIGALKLDAPTYSCNPTKCVPSCWLWCAVCWATCTTQGTMRFAFLPQNAVYQTSASQLAFTLSLSSGLWSTSNTQISVTLSSAGKTYFDEVVAGFYYSAIPFCIAESQALTVSSTTGTASTSAWGTTATWGCTMYLSQSSAYTRMRLSFSSILLSNLDTLSIYASNQAGVSLIGSAFTASNLPTGSVISSSRYMTLVFAADAFAQGGAIVSWGPHLGPISVSPALASAGSTLTLTFSCDLPISTLSLTSGGAPTTISHSISGVVHTVTATMPALSLAHSQNISISLVVNNGAITTDALSVLYLMSPAVDSVWQRGGSTSSPITISGSFFTAPGFTPSVTVGPNACPTTFANETLIVCTVDGTNFPLEAPQPVTVSVSSLSSPAAQSATWILVLPSTLSSLSPSVLSPQDSQVVVTLSGTNFGTDPLPVSVLVTEAATQSQCIITWMNETTLVCTALLNPNDTSTQAISFQLTRFLASTNSIFVPLIRQAVLFSVSPPFGIGNVTLHLVGTQLGNFESVLSVTVGLLPCPIVPGSLFNSSEIDCIAPLDPSAAGGRDVILVRSGIPSLPPHPRFVYPGSPALLELSQSLIPTTGSQVFLNGTQLGDDLRWITVLVDGIRLPESAVNLTVPQQQLTALLPPGTGAAAHLVQVSVGGTLSNTLSFAYMPPTILSVSPVSLVANLAQALTIQGANFGTSASLIDITIYTTSCNPAQIIVLNDSAIVCSYFPAISIPETWSDPNTVLRVRVDGQLVTTGFLIRPPSAVFALSPRVGTDAVTLSIQGVSLPNDLAQAASCVFLQGSLSGSGNFTAVVELGTTPATLLSDSGAECGALAWPGTSGVSITVEVQLRIGDSLFAGSPPLQFEYAQAPVLRASCPELLPALALNLFTVFGSGMVENPDLKCLIGGQTSTATFVSTEMVLCATEPSYILGAGTWPLSVTNNGVEISNELSVSFFDQASRLSLVVSPFTSYSGSGPLPIQPVLQLLDARGGNVDVSGVTVTVSVSPPALQLFDSEAVSGAGGEVQFLQLSFRGQHGQSYVLTFSGVGLEPLTFSNITILPCPSVRANSAPSEDLSDCRCLPGYTGVGVECSPCPVGTYKSAPGDEACVACPPKTTTNFSGTQNVSSCVCVANTFRRSPVASCEPCLDGLICLGGDSLQSAAGHWRAPNQPYTAFSCPNELACLGGADSTCAKGYTGVLCAVCDSGYGPIGDQCLRCPSTAINVFLLFLMVCLVLVVMSIMVRSSLDDEGVLSTLVKILVTHIQAMAFIGNFSVSWPVGFRSLLEGITMFAANSGISIRCLLNMQYYDRLLVVFLLPVIVVVLVAFAFAALLSTKKVLRHSFQLSSYRQKFWTTVLFVLYILHPSILNEVVAFFNCVKVGSRSYLQSDMSVSCDTTTYMSWRILTIVYLVVYCIGAVLFVVGLLWRRREQFFAQDKELLRRFQFLTSGYLPQFFYWEALLMAQKLVLVLIAVFFSVWLQIFFGVWSLILFYELHLICKPFENRAALDLEGKSLRLLLLSVVLGMLFESGELSFGVTVFLDVLIITLHTLFIFLFVRLYYKQGGLKKLQELKAEHGSRLTGAFSKSLRQSLWRFSSILAAPAAHEAVPQESGRSSRANSRMGSGQTTPTNQQSIPLRTLSSAALPPPPSSAAPQL